MRNTHSGSGSLILSVPTRVLALLYSTPHHRARARRAAQTYIEQSNADGPHSPQSGPTDGGRLRGEHHGTTLARQAVSRGSIPKERQRDEGARPSTRRSFGAMFGARRREGGQHQEEPMQPRVGAGADELAGILSSNEGLVIPVAAPCLPASGRSSATSIGRLTPKTGK